MKTCLAFLLAVGLALAPLQAVAMEFKIKGQWIVNFDYGSYGKFSNSGRPTSKSPNPHAYTGYNGGATNTADNFGTNQRVRLQLQAIASEYLSGTVWFEIGDQQWGNAMDRPGGTKFYGGSLGSDGNAVELKNAYIDWVLPSTRLKLRMGIQEVKLPNFVAKTSTILQDDVAGIVASYKINDNADVTGFWFRFYNDNYPGSLAGQANTPANYMDNMDAAGLLLPLSFDGLRITPWAMYAAIGPNVMNPRINKSYSSWNSVPSNTSNQMGNGISSIYTGMLPAVWATKKGQSMRLTEYGNAFWGAVTGEYTGRSPFRMAWELAYGSVAYEHAQLNRAGWEAFGLGEYKLDWAIPGVYAWYSSGDTGDIKNGSQRMPTLRSTTGNDLSKYASNGNVISRKNAVTAVWTGTWGFGARLKDISFFENLKHTLRVNHFMGTNDPVMAKYFLGKKNANGDYTTTRVGTDFNAGVEGIYLTTRDSATEFSLVNEWQIYKNLRMNLEGHYVMLNLDTSRGVWGRGPVASGGWVGNPNLRDAWQCNLSFYYSF